MEIKISGALAGLLVLSSFSAYCQSGPPRSMRLCTTSDCKTLTWYNDHYDGVQDGQNSVGTIFTITRWRGDGVELSGKTTRPIPGSEYYITAVFSGKISQEGGSISGGEVRWKIGPKSGMGPFTLTWKDESLRPREVTFGPPPLPIAMRFCDVNCVTLELQKNNEYLAKNGNERWTVQTFTRETAKFTRFVKNPEFTITYEGSVSDDGNRLVGVANPFYRKNGDGQPVDIFLNWDLATVQQLTHEDAQYRFVNRPPNINPDIAWLLLFGLLVANSDGGVDAPHETYHPHPPPIYPYVDRRSSPR